MTRRTRRPRRAGERIRRRHAEANSAPGNNGPAAILAREWSIVGQGKSKAYRSSSRIESYVAVIFCILYIILVGYSVVAPRRADVDQANTITVPASAAAGQSNEAPEARAKCVATRLRVSRSSAHLSLQAATARWRNVCGCDCVEDQANS